MAPPPARPLCLRHRGGAGGPELRGLRVRFTGLTSVAAELPNLVSYTGGVVLK